MGKFADVVNDVDRYPNDDFVIEHWKRNILNRIDREWGCSFVYMVDQDGTHHCEWPEHDPFSNRCYDHTPGVMHSWEK
jgi:hypothetical protein